MMKEKGVLEQRLWAVIIKSLYLTINFKKQTWQDNFSWDGHLEHLEQKLNSSIITIKRIKKFIPHVLSLSVLFLI